MKVRHVNHIGINVVDLAAAKEFFTDLGFIVVGESTMEGELLNKINGLKNAQIELAMVQAPDGELNLELTKYIQPVDPKGIRALAPNALGLGHIALEVDELEKIVATLKQKGHELVGEVQTFENSWKLCYIRGPEGIIVELAEQP
jgi:catechol 2,3-dioxygenase-like lactoylglutathione lyase family enzyme